MADSKIARTTRKYLVRGAIFSLVAGCIALFGHMPQAVAGKPTTWIVIDTNGQVVSQHDPDALNYPASLTKMMTLFLTFDALEHHRLSLDQRFSVSRHASVQQPSKLGLVPGSTISVHDLILAVVTHSANDAAVVLAEGLGGSESAFAARMNREARILGMNRTNFRNASGLPDRFQYTTARDLSKLALALYRTFPREYAYFATEHFTYNGETYGTHNHLMEAFQGMDGIKTGFINASGFNLAASAVRNNRRLVGVIMGGRTAESRDMEMAELLDDAFAHRGMGIPSTIAVASSEAPDRGGLNLRNGDNLSVISAAADATPAETATAPIRQEHVYRVASMHGRRGHHPVRLAAHHHLRHGVVLASAEERHHAVAPAHRYRHTAAASHRHRVARRYARSNRYQLVATTHRSAGNRRYAALHRHNTAVRSANTSKTAFSHHHGVACGGWNGNNQPCPRAMHGGPVRRYGLRSAETRRGRAEPTG